MMQGTPGRTCPGVPCMALLFTFGIQIETPQTRL